MRSIGPYFAGPVLGDQLFQPARAGAAGGDLGHQVALALGRCADVGQKEPELVPVDLPPTAEFHRRDTQALLINLTTQSHGAGIGAADVRVVGAGGHVKHGQAGGWRLETGGRRRSWTFGPWTLDLGPWTLHRHHQGDVGQVGAPGKWIVEHRDVARLQPELIEGRPHRHGHRSQVHGHEVAHGQHPPRAIEHGAGIIAALLDVGGERRAAQRRAHLLGNGVERALINLQQNRIKQIADCGLRIADCPPPGQSPSCVAFGLIPHSAIRNPQLAGCRTRPRGRRTRQAKTLSRCTR